MKPRKGLLGLSAFGLFGIFLQNFIGCLSRCLSNNIEFGGFIVEKKIGGDSLNYKYKLRIYCLYHVYRFSVLRCTSELTEIFRVRFLGEVQVLLTWPSCSRN